MKENEYIKMEATGLRVSDDYFAARPGLDTSMNRKLLTDGFERGYKHARDHIVDIVSSEEELPGPMPNEVWASIQQSVLTNNREQLAEQLRSIVRSTKQSITARIEAGE